MENETVSRSRVFRDTYLPGAYVRLRNQSYGKVIGVRSYSSGLEGVDKEQLRETVMNFLNDWELAGGSVDAGFKLAAQRRTLEIQSPSELFVQPAPIILCCKTCNVMDFYDTRVGEDKHLAKMEARIRTHYGREYIACKRNGCKGHMIQIPYVAVHRCGFADEIFIPFAARRAANLGYVDKGSFILSSFFDVDTAVRLGTALQDECPHCKGNYPKDTNKEGTPLSYAFYSQSLQYIALSEERGRLIAQLLEVIQDTNGALTGHAADIAEGVASALLGRITSRELDTKLTTLLSKKVGDNDAQQALRDKLEKKRQTARKYEAMQPLDEDLQEMLDSVKAEIQRMELDLGSSSGAFHSVREDIADDGTLTTIIRLRRSLEAVFLNHDVTATTVETAILHATDQIQKEALSMQWALVQQRYGIESIAHIPDLRVILTTLGYSREKNNPAIAIDSPPVNLNAFADTLDPSLRGKIPIYAMHAQTEALWIRLDPRKVLGWCVKHAGWAVPDKGILESRSKSHAHLLQHCAALAIHPGKVNHETAAAPKHLSAPFHLLHTISHALMLTARRHTGYDSKSVQEYLLPTDLSVILYVSSVQNYTSGGLLTLFQHYLLPWFDDASLFAFNCAFDPVCSDNGGSCSGCVQTEIGCETFNYGLSRTYLHGGPIDRDASLMIKQGYWADESS